MLVRVETKDGVEGWGEAYGPAAPAAAAVRELFGPMLVGVDPRAVEAIWERLFARTVDYGQKGSTVAALSALDIALWDIKSKDAGLPLYRALGGAETESMRCYATGFYWVEGNLNERFVSEAEAYLADGFRAMKVKVGQGIERDVELVKLVRCTVGSDVRVMIDANHAYTPTEAIALARRLDEDCIHWFEEPVSPIDVEGYLEVKRKIDIPLAGGECEHSRFGFEPWLRKRAFDYVQPDLCACGGITEGMKIATLASLTGVHLTPHAWGSAIGQAAALHFYAARPRQPFTTTAEDKMIECDRSENPLRTTIVKRPIEFEDGSWKLPTEPGLGVEIVREALRQFE